MSVYSKIYQIRNLIKKSVHPIMFFDCDTDGGTSYLQLKKVFPKINGFSMFKDFEKQKVLLNKIENKHDTVIIFDIPYLTEEFLEGIKNKKIIWVDHHLENSKEQIKKYKIIHFNPLNFDLNDNRPSSYWAYKIANSKENLFYVTLGSVSDFFLLDVIIKFYKQNEKNFNALFKISKEDKKELFEFIKNNKFNDEKTKEKREYWIRYLTYESKLIEFKNLFDFMYKLEKEEDILNAFKLISKMNAFELKININNGEGFLFKEYNEMMKKYKILFEKAIKENEYNKEFIYFEYSGKASFTKTISEELCHKFTKHKVVLVVFKKDKSDQISFSFRGNNFDVNKLVRKSLEGLNGIGGGHKFAAGGMVKEKDFEEFKKIIFENIKKYCKQEILLRN